MPEYKLTDEMRDKIREIMGPHIFTVTREDALMQAAVEVLDAKAERDRLQLLLEAVRGEMRTLAAIVIGQQGGLRLVLTRRELEAIPSDAEVHVTTPEPGVRIYELRSKAGTPAPTPTVN